MAEYYDSNSDTLDLQTFIGQLKAQAELLLRTSNALYEATKSPHDPLFDVGAVQNRVRHALQLIPQSDYQSLHHHDMPFPTLQHNYDDSVQLSSHHTLPRDGLHTLPVARSGSGSDGTPSAGVSFSSTSSHSFPRTHTVPRVPQQGVQQRGIPSLSGHTPASSSHSFRRKDQLHMERQQIISASLNPNNQTHSISAPEGTIFKDGKWVSTTGDVDETFEDLDNIFDFDDENYNPEANRGNNVVSAIGANDGLSLILPAMSTSTTLSSSPISTSRGTPKSGAFKPRRNTTSKLHQYGTIKVELNKLLQDDEDGDEDRPFQTAPQSTGKQGYVRLLSTTNHTVDGYRDDALDADDLQVYAKLDEIDIAQPTIRQHAAPDDLETLSMTSGVVSSSGESDMTEMLSDDSHSHKQVGLSKELEIDIDMDEFDMMDDDEEDSRPYAERLSVKVAAPKESENGPSKELYEFDLPPDLQVVFRKTDQQHHSLLASQ